MDEGILAGTVAFFVAFAVCITALAMVGCRSRGAALSASTLAGACWAAVAVAVATATWWLAAVPAVGSAVLGIGATFFAEARRPKERP